MDTLVSFSSRTRTCFQDAELYWWLNWSDLSLTEIQWWRGS